MVNIFCHDHHHPHQDICHDCQALLDYAHQRLDKCPFEDQKPACNKCTVHCYSAKMRDKVRQVMLYAGPRMTLRHPLLALQHMADLIGRVPTLKKNNKGGKG